MRTFLSLTLVLIYFKIDQLANGCTRPPIVTGYSRPHGVLVSTYNLTWQPAACNMDNIIQYKIQFVESCTAIQPVTIQTGNNKTTALIVVPACADTGCYLRISAQLSVSLHTDYSPCILINDSLVEQQIQIEQYHQVCVLIRGACSSGAASQFFINEHMIQRPRSYTMPYNITRSLDLGTYSFCVSNVTEDMVLIEYCYQAHLAGCSFCPLSLGEAEFLSHIEILQIQSEVDSTVTVQEHSKPDDSNISYEVDYPDSNNLSPLFNSTISTNFLDKYFLIIIIGGASVGIICSIVIAILIAVCCHKLIKTAKSVKTGNIYDEPSLPDPIYHEVKIKTLSNIDMTGNDSYGCNMQHTRSKEAII